MNIFSGIMAKVAAVFAAIAGVFFVVMRIQSKKIDTLKHDNKIITKKAEIQNDDAIFKAEILANEQDEILKEVKKDDSKSKFDKLNDL